MIISETIKDVIMHAEGKALATYGGGEINVAPVSTIKILEDGKILLINYFMNKTLANILENPKVSLACWRDLEGYQIKGEVEYQESGELFE